MAFRKPGTFTLVKDNVLDIDERELSNPFNFYKLLLSDDLRKWLRNNGLLVDSTKGFRCFKCGEPFRWQRREKNYDKEVFDCRNKHETTIRTNSIFTHSKLSIPDILHFTYLYVENGLSLLTCARKCGISYCGTAVKWSQTIRELFCEYYHIFVQNEQLKGTVIVTKLLAGEKYKQQVVGDKYRSKNGGQKHDSDVWIIGLQEKYSKRILLFPVTDISSSAIENIIRDHVTPGSTIYSILENLQPEGYTIHTTLCPPNAQNFISKKVLSIAATGISMGSVANFESHLCYILWQNRIPPAERYNAFLDLVRRVYTLHKPPEFTYTTPVFNTWNVDTGEKVAQVTAKTASIISDNDASVFTHEDKSVLSTKASVSHLDTIPVHIETALKSATSDNCGISESSADEQQQEAVVDTEVPYINQLNSLVTKSPQQITLHHFTLLPTNRSQQQEQESSITETQYYGEILGIERDVWHQPYCTNCYATSGYHTREGGWTCIQCDYTSDDIECHYQLTFNVKIGGNIHNVNMFGKSLNDIFGVPSFQLMPVIQQISSEVGESKSVNECIQRSLKLLLHDRRVIITFPPNTVMADTNKIASHISLVDDAKSNTNYWNEVQVKQSDTVVDLLQYALERKFPKLDIGAFFTKITDSKLPSQGPTGVSFKKHKSK